MSEDRQTAFWIVVALASAVICMTGCGESVARGVADGAASGAANAVKGAINGAPDGDSSMASIVQYMSKWGVGIGMLVSIASAFLFFLVSRKVGLAMLGSGLSVITLCMITHQLAPVIEIAITILIIAGIIASVALAVCSWRTWVWWAERKFRIKLDGDDFYGDPMDQAETEALERK